MTHVKNFKIINFTLKKVASVLLKN